MQQGVTHFWRTAGIKHFHLIDTFIFQRNIWIYKRIENEILLKPQAPEMLLEEKQLREQVYAAVMKLPEKQAKRIYARYYLGMTVNEIAEVEGVDPSRVRDSIRRGLKQLVKYF